MIKLTIILIIFVKTSQQIINGSRPKTDKPYMVYLLKAEEPRSPYHATQDPTGWTCGGAIIHPLYILTSSICLVDIEQVYVISGYRHYVSAERIDTDPCLSNMRKRVIAHCRLETTDYDISNFAKMYYEQPRWVVKDMATARVDTPFEFHDNSYLKFCSYKPAMIRVNYIPKYEAAGTVAMALGWGHTKFYRSVHDFKDYNEHNLMYTTTVIIDREKCAQAYTPNEDSEFYKKGILESSLCTFAPGNVDSDGVPNHYEDLWKQSYNDTYKEKNSIYYSWDRRFMRGKNNTNENNLKDVSTKSIENFKANISNTQKDNPTEYKLMNRKYLRQSDTKNDDMTTIKHEETTKAPEETTKAPDETTKAPEETTKAPEETTKAPEETTKAPEETNQTTKAPGWENEPWSMTGKPDLGPGMGNGICQNDHGGPLVAWIGGHERVIGVATAFKVTKNMECKGPFLFVSTACASQLIICTVSRKEICYINELTCLNCGRSPCFVPANNQVNQLSSVVILYEKQPPSLFPSDTRRRSAGCDEYELYKKGLRIVEKTVSWEGHPDPPNKAVQVLNEDNYEFLDNRYGN